MHASSHENSAILKYLAKEMQSTESSLYRGHTVHMIDAQKTVLRSNPKASLLLPWFKLLRFVHKWRVML